MAVDEALLAAADRSGDAYLRLYRWAPPCLSFGRNEPALARYNRPLIERRGLDVVRRPTGGRAVWHEHEVTYAVAAPIAAFGSLLASYRSIHERLADALRTLGLDASLAPARASVRLDTGPAACFAAPVGGEVLVGGRKVVGSAQVRHGTAFLQHGSILLDGGQDLVTAVTRRPGSATASPATTLSAALGRSVTFSEVVGAIVGTWNASFAHAERPSIRPRSAFADPDWTWRR
jgi:lipoyl(octanoyl) transferase